MPGSRTQRETRHGDRMDQMPTEPASLFPRSVGERLAESRRSKGLSLEDVAAQTRVPLRTLEAIERGDHAALPAATYSVGFVRAFAGLVGLDGAALARDFRAELGQTTVSRATIQPFEPADPARVPTRTLALIALLVAVLIAGSYTAWRTGLFGGYDAEDRALDAAGLDGSSNTATPIAAAPPIATPAADGPVLITATEPVWLRIYEGDSRERLLERELAAGETFTIPATARDPQLLTGRPQAIRVTVGSTVIPPLGSASRTISDVSLKPAALLARLAAPATPATAPQSLTPGGPAGPASTSASTSVQPSASARPGPNAAPPPPPATDPAPPTTATGDSALAPVPATETTE